MIRTALIVLAVAFGVHHAGPVMAVSDSGHHAAICAQCDQGDMGDLIDAGAAACMAILAMAIGVPAARRAFARLVGWELPVPTGPVRARWTATRGPPALAPRNVRLCVLRR